MTSLVDAITDHDGDAGRDVRFPHAPGDWTPAAATNAARGEGLTLGGDHWEALRPAARNIALDRALPEARRSRAS